VNSTRVDKGDIVEPDQTTVRAVIQVIVEALGIEDRAESFDAATPLFGELPELDSLGVMELAVTLEERFGISIDDEDFTVEVFESVTTLTHFVAGRTGDAA